MVDYCDKIQSWQYKINTRQLVRFCRTLMRIFNLLSKINKRINYNPGEESLSKLKEMVKPKAIRGKWDFGKNGIAFSDSSFKKKVIHLLKKSFLQQDQPCDKRKESLIEPQFEALNKNYILKAFPCHGIEA